MKQPIVSNNLIKIKKHKEIDLFFECLLYYEKREIKLAQAKFHDVTKLKKFNRIFWYNGNENGLGLFCLSNHSELDNKTQSIVSLKYAVVYRQENISKVIALVSIKEREIPNYKLFQECGIKKNKRRIEYSRFFITPNNSLIGNIISLKNVSEHLNIPLQCLIVNDKNTDTELFLSDIKETIVKQVSRPLIYYSIKENVLFNPVKSILDNLSKRDSYRILKILVSKFIIGILLFSGFVFYLNINFCQEVSKSTNLFTKFFPNVNIFQNISFFKTLTTFFDSIKSFFVDNIFTEYLCFIFSNSIFSGLICSFIILFLTFRFFHKLRADKIFNENLFISEFLSKRYSATGFLFPFGYSIYVKTSFFGGLMTIKTFNEKVSLKLANYLNNKIGTSINTEINKNNLNEAFSQNFSLSGIFEKHKNVVGNK